MAEKEPDGERVSPVPMGGDALAGRGDEGCDCVCSVASVVASGEEGRESAGGGDVGEVGTEGGGVGTEGGEVRVAMADSDEKSDDFCAGAGVGVEGVLVAMEAASDEAAGGGEVREAMSEA